MTRSLRLTSLALAFTATLFGPALAAPVPPRPLSIDQALTHERIGDVLVDPNGKWFIIMRYPGPGRLPDYGVSLGSDGGMPLLVDAVSGAVRALPGIDLAAFYFGGVVSPRGTKVIFYEQSGQSTHLSIINLVSGKIQRLPYTPERIERALNFVPYWINDKVIAFMASEGSWSSAIGGRINSAWHLIENWRRSWTGLKPAVTVAESRYGVRTTWSGRLVIVDVETGEGRTLAKGGFGDLKASPDGRFLAAALHYKKRYKTSNFKNDGFWRFFFSDPELVIFDLATGERHDVLSGELIDTSTLHWSTDSKKLLFEKYRPGEANSEGMVYVYQPSTRVTNKLGSPMLARQLGRGPAWYGDSPQAPRWVGDSIIMAGSRGGKMGERDWYRITSSGTIDNLTRHYSAVSSSSIGSGKAGVFIIADGHIVLLSENGIKDLTPSLPAHAVSGCKQSDLGGVGNDASPSVAGTGSTICSVSRGALRQSLLVNFDNATVRTIDLSAVPNHIEPLAVSSTGSFVYQLFSDSDIQFRLHSVSDGAKTVLTLNTYLKNVIKPETRLIRYMSRGQLLSSCIMLPQGYRPGRRYPMIVDVYPYTRSRDQCRTPNAYAKDVNHYGSLLAAQWAARGYMVFSHPANPKNVAGNEDAPLAHMAEMVNDAVDAVVAQGYADPERVGLYGISQGGLASLWLATQTERFKAIVSVNGWADLATHYLQAGSAGSLTQTEPFFGYRNRYEVQYSETADVGGLGRNLWEAPDRYIRNSPVFLADRIKTPIMLIHSDLDSAFPMAQYDEMFAALSILGKEATYVRYWGEGHGRTSPANLRDEYERIFAFFDRHLKPDRMAAGVTAHAPRTGHVRSTIPAKARIQSSTALR